MTTSLDEQTVEGQEPLAAQTVVLDSFGRIFDDDSFQAVQRPGLQVHLETSLLEPCKLVVGQDPVVIHITNFENSKQSSLAGFGEILVVVIPQWS